MNVSHDAQSVLLIVLATPWLGVAILLLLRARSKQAAYLRQFPPVDGIPLDALRGDHPFSPWVHAVWNAVWEPQMDDELERQRLETRQVFIYLPLWIFRFPLVTISVFAVLILSGAI
jgi:hypothetical protein